MIRQKHKTYSFNIENLLQDTSEFNLDIDAEYHDEIVSTIAQKIKDTLDDLVAKIFVRKSANGNIHIKVQLSEKIPVFYTLIFRYYLHDDTHRILLDIIRITSNLPFDRLWDYKYQNGKYGYASEWMEVEI
jgi:hypothetical protein